MEAQKGDEVVEIFRNFEEIHSDFGCDLITSGHINRTFRILNGGNSYILQKVNRSIFPNLEGIAENIESVAGYLEQKGYPHPLLKPLAFKDGSWIHRGKWRVFPFIANTKSFEKVESAQQAEASAEFLGLFHRYLHGISVEKIQETIPGFLDFGKRWDAMEEAISKNRAQRKDLVKEELEFLFANQDLLEKWQELEGQIPLRVIHADPKISNFLFSAEEADKILALIDWDTLMPGSILYDFGDMVRSYTNLKEEDDDTTDPSFSLRNYEALKRGFLRHTEEILSESEKAHLDLAGKTVVYVQGIRFLTDYLNGDVYYHTSYADQNLKRARNQMQLLDAMQKSLV